MILDNLVVLTSLERTPMEDKGSGLAPSVGAEKLLVVVQAVDALLDELECREEYGVDDAGTAHGNSETWWAVLIQEYSTI